MCGAERLIGKEMLFTRDVTVAVLDRPYVYIVYLNDQNGFMCYSTAVHDDRDRQAVGGAIVTVCGIGQLCILLLHLSVECCSLLVACARRQPRTQHVINGRLHILVAHPRQPDSGAVLDSGRAVGLDAN